MKKFVVALAVAGCTNVDAKMDAYLARHAVGNELFKSCAKKNKRVAGAALVLSHPEMSSLPKSFLAESLTRAVEEAREPECVELKRSDTLEQQANLEACEAAGKLPVSATTQRQQDFIDKYCK